MLCLGQGHVAFDISYQPNEYMLCMCLVFNCKKKIWGKTTWKSSQSYLDLLHNNMVKFADNILIHFEDL